MRHRKKRNKLSRDAAHREALLSNLCKQLIDHERIKTSQAKAKAVKPEVEQLITLAKRGDLHARRQALATLHNDKFIVHKLFEEVAPRYASGPAATRGSSSWVRASRTRPRWSISSWSRPRAGSPAGSRQLCCFLRRRPAMALAATRGSGAGDRAGPGDPLKTTARS